VPGTTIVEMLHEDLVAERIAIESYTEMIHWFGERDPSTRRMLEEILATEEEHAEEIGDLLRSLSKAEGGTSEKHEHDDEDEVDVAEQRASGQPRDLGFGASHGYPPTRGGPTSPGDVPAGR
jgi:rubrerythrin